MQPIPDGVVEGVTPVDEDVVTEVAAVNRLCNAKSSDMLFASFASACDWSRLDTLPTDGIPLGVVAVPGVEGAVVFCPKTKAKEIRNVKRSEKKQKSPHYLPPFPSLPINIGDEAGEFWLLQLLLFIREFNMGLDPGALLLLPPPPPPFGDMFRCFGEELVEFATGGEDEDLLVVIVGVIGPPALPVAEPPVFVVDSPELENFLLLLSPPPPALLLLLLLLFEEDDEFVADDFFDFSW